MKKNTIIFVIFYNLITYTVLGDEFVDFKKRLDKISELHAHFNQKVTDKNGNLLHEGKGELWMKRPSFFNWHITYPNEYILISDGKTLWIYNPLLEQAVATSVHETIKNIPFMFIFYSQLNDWKEYDVKKINNNFIITPKKNGDNLKKFIINISCDGEIHHFNIIEQDDQTNSYQLTLQEYNMIDVSKFIFIPPDGVIIDDQRNQ